MTIWKLKIHNLLVDLQENWLQWSTDHFKLDVMIRLYERDTKTLVWNILYSYFI
jgi:hypothetical protein